MNESDYNMGIKTHATALLAHTLLRHQPTRHGLMQPLPQTGKGGSTARRKKYHELRRAPTNAHVLRHLDGSLTLATPAQTNDHAACIVIDIDGYAEAIITELLQTAKEHGLWAWGEYDPMRNRGYVWIPISDLMDAHRLKTYGDMLINQTIHNPQQRAVIDNRTANHAITRLPFGKHTYTNQRGILVMQDGLELSIEDERDLALEAWTSLYRSNDSTIIEDELTRSYGPIDQPITVTHTTTAPTVDTRFMTAPEIQTAWNARYTPEDHLRESGARPEYGRSRTWHCCCGHHKNRDRKASLIIRDAKNPKYGRTIVQGFTRGCIFHDDHGRVFDAFNTYAALHSLRNAQMLRHAATTLGVTLIGDTARRAYESRQQDATKRPQSIETLPEVGRATPQRPTSAQKPPYAPKQRAAWDTEAWRLDQHIQVGTDHTVSNGTKAVYAALSEATSQHGYCRWSMDRIAKAAKVSERTAQRATHQLVALGRIAMAHVAAEHTGDQTNFYTLAHGGTPAVALPQEPAPKVTAGGGVSSVSPMVKLRHVRGGNAPATSETPPVPADQPETAGADSHDPASNPLPSTPTAQPSPQGAASDDAPAGDGAVFDPVVAAAFAARPLVAYSGTPRTKSDEQCKAELGTRRGPHEPRQLESECEPQQRPPRRRIAPPYMPSKLAMQAQMGVGLVALADEIARLEKQGRRYFAQKQPTAGRQMMAEAGRLKDALLRRSQCPPNTCW